MPGTDPGRHVVSISSNRHPSPSTTSASASSRFESRLRWVPKPTGRQGMVVRDAAPSGKARENGDREELGEGAELRRTRPRQRFPRRAIDQRPRSAGQRVCGCSDPVPSAAGRGGAPTGTYGATRDVRVDEVAWDIDQHRPGPAAPSDRERLAQDVDDQVGSVDPNRPFRDRREDPVGRDLLRGAAVRVRRRAAPGDDDDRQAADVCLGNTREEVRAAGPRRDEAHPGLTCQLCVRGRHARRRLLVTNEDVRDLGRVVERVVDAQDVPAGKAEDEAHAFRLQEVDDRTTRLHGLPLVRRPG